MLKLLELASYWNCQTARASRAVEPGWAIEAIRVVEAIRNIRTMGAFKVVRVVKLLDLSTCQNYQYVGGVKAIKDNIAIIVIVLVIVINTVVLIAFEVVLVDK